MGKFRFPDFQDTKTAYKYKSDKELKHARLLFRMLRMPVIGPLGKELLQLGLNLGLPVKPVIKATLYEHFVAGETLKDSLPIAQKLYKYGVSSVLDYSVEGSDDENFREKIAQELVQNIEFTAGKKELPFAAFKPTAIFNMTVLEKTGNGEELTADVEIERWARGKKRFKLLCKTAAENKVPVMVDAEETWIQKPIDDLANEMMELYNRDRVIVVNTFQMYRKDRLAYLKESHEMAKEKGYILGAKLVRGAYMEKENKRAKKMGYASPIFDTKEETDASFDAALEYCMHNHESILLVNATHNEDSAKLACHLISELRLNRDHRHICFSQLYGMCDFLSFNLADEGYNVMKYIPYGPLDSVTPYLLRRAEENSAIAGQSLKEIMLIDVELKRRKSEKP